MDNASAYGAEDCRFESCLVQRLLYVYEADESQSYQFAET